MVVRHKRPLRSSFSLVFGRARHRAAATGPDGEAGKNAIEINLHV
jgi:hypothetical protein